MSNKFLSNYPNWDTAPAWANYWAYDEDGSVYYYENEPRLSYNMWLESKEGGNFDFIGYVTTPYNWGNSLQKRPL